MLPTTYFIITVLCSLLVWLGHRIQSRRRLKGLPRVGIDPGFLGLRLPAAKAQFFAHGQELLEQSYAKYKDTPYIIQTVDNERLVVPDRYIEELKNLPDTHISFKEELLDRFMGKYTKMSAVRGSDIHREVVRGPLTKNIGNLLREMKQEAEFGMDKTLGECNAKEFTPVKASALIFNAIGQITSRIIVDEAFSRDPIWLETIMGYTASVAIFSMKMRTINPILRPAAYWTLQSGRKLRADIAKVNEFLLPVIQARQNKIRIDTGDTEGPQDLLQWVLESARGKDAEPEQIVLKILFLIVAAMHTSAITTIHVLYDLCAHPASMADLCAEAEAEIISGGWTLATLLRLRKMESFLKESGRVNSAGVVSFQRLVLKPIRLSNGFTIPENTHICAASDARSRDPALYSAPTEFQPLRFYQTDAEIDSAKLFSSVAAGDSWFGFGRQACSGRWYASAQIKLVLCLLLLNYEIKFPVGQKERPRNWVKDEKTGPDMEQIILVKKRGG
ncbi:cytochrome P450 [Byssothecium circinans]|uniref:Cytochrome P450 n=1 Tax=Byssothecium circinans TaxID=147558 RepID=A0A6A5TCE1_9PLEO|nr:cytochrome P450 [Byssothecium circinans]